ncbi:MAG TPA: hypothetical protein VG710_12055 [Opitutus sp.]|nr:hypothetical protein [Opitutus sp.]
MTTAAGHQALIAPDKYRANAARTIGIAAIFAASLATAGWKTSATLSTRAGYDSNVFLQDSAPAPSYSGAVRPRVGSFVGDLAASVAVEGAVSPQLNLAASYAPEAMWFHTQSGEDNVTHRLSLLFSGRGDATTWSLQSAATRIDGASQGPIFGCEGGATAIGGIPLRDRRDAFIERSTFKLTRTRGAWFLRPVATAYFHDFLTKQSSRPGYENYIDRSEYTGGIDLGRNVSAQDRLYLGYRYGRQDQLKLLGVDSPYDWNLQRFLAGFEGVPVAWLKLNLLAGPELRRAARPLPTGCDDDRTVWWLDASASVTAGPRDTIALNARRYAQPSFASFGSYEDITYEGLWRHDFGRGLVANAGYKAYGGKWMATAVRSDWILTPSLALSYALNRRLSLDANWSADRASSRVPAKPGREYVRQLSFLSARYVL